MNLTPPRKKSVVDWDGYFSEMRKEKREEREINYKNFVKKEMGQKRSKMGRVKWKNPIN